MSKRREFLRPSRAVPADLDFESAKVGSEPRDRAKRPTITMKGGGDAAASVVDAPPEAIERGRTIHEQQLREQAEAHRRERSTNELHGDRRQTLSKPE